MKEYLSTINLVAMGTFTMFIITTRLLIVQIIGMVDLMNQTDKFVADWKICANAPHPDSFSNVTVAFPFEKCDLKYTANCNVDNTPNEYGKATCGYDFTIDFKRDFAFNAQRYHAIFEKHAYHLVNPNSFHVVAFLNSGESSVSALSVVKGVASNGGFIGDTENVFGNDVALSGSCI